MITDKNFHKIADEVYKVDPLKEPDWDKQVKIDYEFKSSGQTFIVLDVVGNSASPTANGMQAMAVAPIVNEKPDYSQIVIAYAGTNDKDEADIATDVQNVILLEKDFDPFVWSDKAGQKMDSQLKTALDFADKIKNDPRFKGADISYTGHSLGGFLASYVGIVNESEVTAFNAPQSYPRFLTKEQKKWAKNNRDKLVNYRNKDDHVGNFGGDPLGISYLLDMGKPKKSENFLDDIINYHHALSTWKFDDKTGMVVDAKGNVARGQAIYYNQTAKVAMERVKRVYKDHLRAGMTGTRMIFLDGIQALTIGTAMSQASQAGTEEIGRYRDQAISDIEALWAGIDFSDFSELTDAEIWAIFQQEGVTKETVVAKTASYFDQRVKKATELSEHFSQLEMDITTMVQEKQAKDSELARMFETW